MRTIEVYKIPGLAFYVNNLFSDQVRANKAVLLGKIPLTEKLLKKQKKSGGHYSKKSFERYIRTEMNDAKNKEMNDAVSAYSEILEKMAQQD